MNRQLARLAALPVFLALVHPFLRAQCPQIEAVMIDACGLEQLNEFVIIRSGGGFNTADIELDYDANNNILGPNNNDINTDNGNWSADPTPCGLTTGNPAAFTGCPNLIAVGPGVDIPPNAIVVLQNSTGSTNGQYDFSSLCAAGQCIYVIASSCTRSAGGFTNGAGSGTRTTNFSIAGTCVQTFTYNLASLTGGNGGYYLPLTNTYGNSGCVVPPVTAPSLLPPNINPIANVSVCGDYTLPPITGTNLSANVAYYTGMNGTGTQYQPGDVITTTTTLYAFDQNGPVGCTDQESFTITILPPPTVNQPADVVVCAGQNVNVPVTGSAGATFPWTNDNTAVGLGASGTGNINFTAANVSGTEVALITITPTQGSCTGTPVSFTVTVNPRPTVDDPLNVSVCAGDPVNVSFSGSGVSPTYNWTNNNTAIGLPSSGSGDIGFNAANVAVTQTATITVTPVENGCTGTPQTFTISVVPLPVVNPPANVTVCGGLPVSVAFTGSAGATFSWTNDNTAVGLAASGAGNISFTSSAVTATEIATVTVTPTNAAGTCDGAPVTFTITVNPGPEVDPIADQSVCAGDFVSVAFGSPNNPVFNWTNSNTAIGLPASGAGNINFTTANVGTVQTGTVTVTPIQAGCSGIPQTFTITVSPAPFVDPPNNVTVCGGSPVNVSFTGTPGADFNWISDNTSIGLGSSGAGNISFTTANPATQQIATITVTPAFGACEGTAETFTITVNPSPTMSDPPNQSVCGGNPVSVNFTSPNSPAYSWTNSNTAIGLPASGNGNISFTAAFVAAAQTGTISVTPTQNGCPGTPQTFTITVNPAPTVNLPANITICANQSIVISLSGSTGAAFNWVNSNPAIGLPASGSGNISLTAANVATQQAGTVTITPSIGSCNGVPVSFTITVNPLPTVVDPADQTVCAGAIVAVNFSSPNSPAFNWTNNNPAIGLPASGSGNISFTAANVAAAQTATLTVTPVQNGCTGTAQTFNITVNPAPGVNQPANVSVCHGDPVAVNFTGSAGAAFAWTNDNPAVGLGAGGSGNISFTAANVAVSQTANITVTPTANGCPGTPATFTITVNTGVSMNNPGNQTACAGDTVSIPFTGNGNPSFAWTNDNTAVGLAASGTGNINFTAASVTTPQTATITVTPTAGSCAGIPVAFTLIVRPLTSVNNPGNQTVCAGDSVGVTFTGTGNPVFSWTNDNPAIGLPASGTGDISFFTANVATPQTATITVTPAATGAYAYITNFASDNISVIDLTTNTVTATIGVGDSPYGIWVDPVGNRIYVTNWNTPGTLTIIDASTNTVLSAIGVGSNPVGVTVSPDGNRVYVTNQFSSAVSVIDPVTNTILANIPVNYNPIGVCVAPDGKRVYVATNSTLSTVAVIDAATNTVTGLIPTTDGAKGIAIKPDGSQLYAANPFANTVTVINVPANTIAATLAVGNSPNGVAVSPDGTRVYVANENSGSVSVIDATANTVIATIPVEFGPTGVSVTPDGMWVYVANVLSNSVSVIDASTNTVATTVAVGDAPIAFGSFIAPGASCTGPVQTFTITVNPIPSVAQPANVSACTGDPVGVNFAGTAGAAFTWTNDNPAVGLPASGSGNISFTAANVATQQTANITVTPVANGCTGTPVTFAVAVNPGVSVNNPGNQSACVGDPVSVTFSGNGNPAFAWTNDNPAIGLPASGSGNISFTAANVAVPQTANITVTPAGAGCAGAAQTFAITVGPLPTLAQPNNVTACGNVTTNIPFSPSAGATVSWTNDNPAIGLPASGTGNISFIAANVAAPQTAVITATPVLGTCTGAPVTFTATVNPPAMGSISGNLLLCTGDSTTLTAMGGVSYEWDSGLLTPSITVSPATSTTYTAIITNASGCAVAVSAFVDVNPAPVAAISGDTAVCAGQSITLTASGGGSYSWSNSGAAAAITVSPAATATFTVTVTNAFACTATDSATVTVHQPDSTLLSATSCQPADTGTVVQIMPNQFGCDSTVITVTSLSPGSITNLTQFSCDSASTGTFTQNLFNQFGCDSTVVTTVLFNPAAIDTTYLTKTTCDPAQAGITQSLLSGADGCDSLVITTTALLPGNTVNLSATTCHAGNAGVFTQNLFNQYGCDSTVVTTVIFDPALLDTTLLSKTTCNPAQAGTVQNMLIGADGCDSLVITTTTLLPSNTNNLTATTCDPSQAGVFTQNLFNQYGCDSTVITTVTLLPSNTVDLTTFTCDSSQAGVFTQNLFNQFGCDSTVTTTVLFDPSLIDITFLSGFTCNPDSAGTFQTVLSGSDGCDSVVVLALTLHPSDTLTITSFTCDPATAGTFVTVLTNQYGCDSVLISEVIFDPGPCAPGATLSGTNVTCGGGTDGSFTLQILNGQPPIQYDWAGSGGNTGTGQITNLSTPVVVNNLPAGNYTVTVTDLSNQASSTVTVTLTAPPPLTTGAFAVPAFNGFGVSCADATDGTVNTAVNGGTPPYQYSWSNSTVGPSLNNAGAGQYSVVVTDANGCTAQAAATLTAPLPLKFALTVSPADCGDTLVDASVLAAGGLAPYTITLDGNALAGTMPSIGAGTHTLSITDANGCTDDSTLTLVLPPAPQISLPPDTSVVIGHPVRIEASTNLTIWNSLTWQPLPDTACPACLVQQWTPQQSQVITVTVVDTFGCTARAVIRVLVERVIELFVPNIFSPNGDGANDVWKMNAGASVTEIQEVQVFDRWGNLQYLWDNPLAPNEWPGWDGITKGKKAEVGVYVYYLKVKLADGTTTVLKGDVTIVER